MQYRSQKYFLEGAMETWRESEVESIFSVNFFITEKHSVMDGEATFLRYWVYAFLLVIFLLGMGIYYEDE